MATSLVADVHLRTPNAAMVEVGGVAEGGSVDTLVAVGRPLTEVLVDDGHVGDGVLLERRLDGRLVGELLQRQWVVRQAGHHEVVDNPLLVHHSHTEIATKP